MEAKEKESQTEMKAKEKESLPGMETGEDRRKSVSAIDKTKSAPIPPKSGNESALEGNGPSSKNRLSKTNAPPS